MLKLTLIFLAAMVSQSFAQNSAREQPGMGETPAPAALTAGYSAIITPITAQAEGQPGFGSHLPAGAHFGGPNQAGTYAQPTSSQGKVYPTNLENYNQFPQLTIQPSIGPNTPHKILPVISQPFPLPGETQPAPPFPQLPSPPVMRGAPQGFNPATNASPVTLGPDQPQPRGFISNIGH